METFRCNFLSPKAVLSSVPLDGQVFPNYCAQSFGEGTYASV